MWKVMLDWKQNRKSRMQAWCTGIIFSWQVGRIPDKSKTCQVEISPDMSRLTCQEILSLLLRSRILTWQVPRLGNHLAGKAKFRLTKLLECQEPKYPYLTVTWRNWRGKGGQSQGPHTPLWWVPPIKLASYGAAGSQNSRRATESEAIIIFRMSYGMMLFELTLRDLLFLLGR